MKSNAKDIKKCKTCDKCKIIHVKVGVKLRSGKLHYCEANKKLVDVDDKCRKWTKRELEYDLSSQRFDKAQDDMNAILAHLKAHYKD